ncbi:hypothetical protein CASFOL_006705 [Castilleja foliolosa]|uniref:F-box domain-containing protein n=1 Tax=Castilleja foliolosa TaxID=1961234 RepID=A0ABD3E969_9LAMI
MKKGNQIEAINGEFQLPEPIIHHIKSFLTAKEAAQTAILSKSWRSAWLTRPNLDFPIPYHGKDKYLELAENTIQRYEQSNLKIESLFIHGSLGVEFVDLANDLITRALKIGATHLSVHNSSTEMVLSQGVFEAENVIELSLHGFKIEDLGFDRKVRCSKLESLNLSSVIISSEMISNIALCCPLIRKLSLCDVATFRFVIPFKHDDDDYDDDDDDDDNDDVYYSFSRLPSLKDLTIRECRIQEVSCPSLERLYFATKHYTSVKFDVPSIRKFRFEIECDEIPSLCFVSTPREWESDVFIRTYRRGFSTLWFLRLNKLLTELSLSKMYLSLNMSLYEYCWYEVGAIRGLPKPKVESLTLDMFRVGALPCFALFHGLFQICRPTFIVVNMLGDDDGIANNNTLRNTLARGLDDKCMYGLHDLEEVNVHLFDEDVDVWRPLPLESLLDPSISLSGRQKTRFQLKWKM